MTTESSKNFTRLDDLPGESQRTVLGYLDAVAGLDEIRRMRSEALRLFAPAEGERLLDAGCGVGEIARQLGARVGPHGSVDAVDHSVQAVSVARSRHDGGPVTYGVGDILKLEFPDGHFDGVRAERVLQHLSDPDGAIGELARVTRPGGRVCVIDTDWTSWTCDGFDHLDEVVAALPLPNSPDAGRRVRSRMLRAGLREVTTLPVALCFTTPADASVIAPFFNRAVVSGRVPEELCERFLGSVDRSTERGDFLFAFTMWISLGHVPADAHR